MVGKPVVLCGCRHHPCIVFGYFIFPEKYLPISVSIFSKINRLNIISISPHILTAITEELQISANNRCAGNRVC